MTAMQRGLVILASTAVALVILSSLATQFLAWWLSFHPGLGQPWFAHIYAPWSWLDWHVRYQSSMPAAFNILYSGAAAIAAAGGLMAAALRDQNAKRYADVHGTAHWANRRQVEATGLLPRRGRTGGGVYVGGWRHRGQLHYLRHDGLSCVYLLAPHN